MQQDQADWGARWLSNFDRWLSSAENALNLVAGLCIFALMLAGITQIVGRQFLNTPVYGYIDLVELSMATFAFLGIAYCQRVGGHVRMELFVKAMPKRPQWITEIFGVAIALFIVLVLTFYGLQHAIRAFQYGDSTIDANFPLWPSKLMVPLAFLFLCFRLTLQLAGYLRLALHPALKPIAVPEIQSVEELAEQEISDALGGEKEKLEEAQDAV